MKMKAWRKLAAMGFVATAFAAGCVVSSDDDDDGGDAGSRGGTAGSGGSSGTSGSAGKGGTSGSAGSDASAGTDGGAAQATCMPAQYPDAGDAGEDAACQRCIETQCCSEYLRCANDDRATPCWGAGGEIFCTQGCIIDWLEANPGMAADEMTKRTCVMSCAKRGSISGATNELYACINEGERADGATGTPGCAVECFGG